MTDPIAHRGPDDQGFWIDADAGVGLGHRRLAIIDLSPSGHQPMISSDGRWVLSFNGEIYNHLRLRAELDSSGREGAWNGHSDTETLVEAIARWGLEQTLRRCVGMFAIALWDRNSRELHLVRDRFGEKPLYYGWVGGDFLFGSELKTMRRHPLFDNPVDRRALRLYASRTYIPAPLSIYQHVYKLQPGCILTLPANAYKLRPDHPPSIGAPGLGLRIQQYWSYRDVVAGGLRDPIEREEEALERLDDTLTQAVRDQSVADVPVGAFLSGGIDSSTIVALYQRTSSRPVRTFTIGFEEAGFNEAEYAKRVALHLGTEHHERYVSVREAQEIIPLLPSIYDEPFADSSQIPTFIVSRFAGEQVKVTLSGDGGDELFGGYNRYFAAAQWWARIREMPAPMRAAAGRILAQVPAGGWNGLARMLLGGRRPPHFGAKVQKAFRTVTQANTLDEIFGSFLDEWAGERSPVIGGEEPIVACAFDLNVGEQAPDAVRMMYCDASSYLPDDILCKVDRASMAVSLEGRIPFLDHRVAELAAHIPSRMNIQGGRGKMVLRKLLYREAPAELFERPKAGFGIPVGEWIKGPLRDWAEDLLSSKELDEGGFFDSKIVRRRWQQHLSGTRESTPALWAILMFEAWRRANEECLRDEAA